MFCNKCGTQLSENAKFCWSCGAGITPAEEAVIPPQVPEAEAPILQEAPVEPVTEASGYEQPTWTPPVESEQPKKPRKKWIPFAIIGGTVAAIAAIVLGLFFTGFFDNDSTRLQKAMTKSAGAFAEAIEALDLPDFQYMQDENAYSAEFAFTLNKIQDNAELNGLGISGSLDYNLPGKQLDLILTPSYGAIDLLNAQIKLDDNMLYLGSPELTGNTFYSFNTETLLKDVAKLDAEVAGMEDIRINVFELLQILGGESADNNEDQQKLAKAGEDLKNAMQAEKVGTEEISVNGHDLKCDKYNVIFTKEAIRAYFEIALDATMRSYSSDILLKICESLNIPEEMTAGTDLTMPAPVANEFTEAIREALGEIDDLEMIFYVNDGYVVAIVYETEIEDSPIAFVVNIGGGENYVDDLSFSITVDGQTILLESTGNHAGKNGKFTDETKLYLKAQGFSMRILSSSLSFDSKKSADNLQWTIGIPSTTINVSGNISFDDKSMAVDLYDCSISQTGEELLAIRLYYSVGEFAPSIQVDDSIELLKLTVDEIKAEATALNESIEQWALGKADQIPMLLELFS